MPEQKPSKTLCRLVVWSTSDAHRYGGEDAAFFVTRTPPNRSALRNTEAGYRKCEAYRLSWQIRFAYIAQVKSDTCAELIIRDDYLTVIVHSCFFSRQAEIS